ncbi:glutathione S-transferase [Thozetella sp. PMI_491]|nr:glutathione S-transferase [Thozetella sp. PMI_491]
MASIKPLLLHAHSTGPNPIKIAIALEMLKVPYNLQLWQLGDNPENGVKSAKFLKITPNGRVPALEDPNTGVVSWESGAIMNYIRRMYDKENLLGPRDSGEQGIVDFEKWEYFLLTTLGPMTGQTNWFRRYHHTQNEDALNRYVEQTTYYYGVFEGQLKTTEGESVLPGGITAVDLHFLPWLNQHDVAGLSLEPYPNITKWLKKMLGLAEVQRAFQRIKEAAGK